MKDLQDLIDKYSKLDHNLVLSDIYVKNRQNYPWCLKISSLNVLDMLEHNKNAFGTYSYLTMLHFVTIAYIDKTINILQRIFHTWSVVFISRLWVEWIRYKFVTQIRKKIDQNRMPPYKIIEHYFMTFPTFHSIELNASMLTFIAIFVFNKKLPVESLRIYLFSSQP